MKSLAKNIVMWSSQILAGLLLLEFACILGCQRTTSKVEASTDAVGQATFATPQEAGQALQAAARANDESALAHVLGANSRAILSSGDVTEDKAAIAEFVAKYDRMNRWVTMTDGSQVLYIGADNYPYPISLARNAASQWYFNTGAGKDEILARRIGKNELLAIDAVSAMGNAEQLYFKSAHDGNQPHHYTQKILSTPGKQDGLYWEVPPDQPSSPLGRLNDFARDVVSSTQPGAPPIFDGYSFRILAAQGNKASDGARSYLVGGKMTGGFAIQASPVTYGDSGIMTFILNRDGVVYQKDLGPNTACIAAATDSYDPHDGWTRAE